jgi:hypothetical protein
MRGGARVERSAALGSGAARVCLRLLAPDTGVAVPEVRTGTITITGLQTGTMMLPADSRYGRANGRGVAGGEVLTARSTGDPLGLPAFAVTWEAPAFPAMMSPQLSRSALASIDPTRDLEVTWSPSPQGGGTMVLTFCGTLVPPGSQSAIATCRFRANAGAGRVPSSVLGAFHRQQFVDCGCCSDCIHLDRSGLGGFALYRRNRGRVRPVRASVARIAHPAHLA